MKQKICIWIVCSVTIDVDQAMCGVIAMKQKKSIEWEALDVSQM